MTAEPELAAFDYALPPERVAQHPASERDGARLLVLDRQHGHTRDAHVRDLPDGLEAGDVLVVNASRVVPARLRGRKQTGGGAEVLLLGPVPGTPHRYAALLRCRGRTRPGLKLRLGVPGHELDAEVTAVEDDGAVTLAFESGASPWVAGEPPLPPYIRRPHPDPADRDRYQTVYARVPGSVAAPTAGLHLSERLLQRLAERGVEIAEIVLHVGLGTFRAPGARELASGRLHPERFELDEAVSAQIARARARGSRIVAVGTTTCRVLETCASPDGRVVPRRGETDLFIRPGFSFRVVDALLTNFHLPRSSLLMLVAAFAGREAILSAYVQAIRSGYRFYSYGDAMLIR